MGLLFKCVYFLFKSMSGANLYSKTELFVKNWYIQSCNAIAKLAPFPQHLILFLSKSLKGLQSYYKL